MDTYEIEYHISWHFKQNLDIGSFMKKNIEIKGW